jgi:hypothetical protein
MSSDREPRVIGHLPFTDDAERDVHEDAAGRPCVVGDDGEPVYGTWLPPADEPIDVTPPVDSGRGTGTLIDEFL